MQWQNHYNANIIIFPDSASVSMQNPGGDEHLAPSGTGFIPGL
jgi:hypothetical protein